MEALDLTILAAAGMAYAVLSARLGRTILTPAIFFLSAGILLGDAVLGWFSGRSQWRRAPPDRRDDARTRALRRCVANQPPALDAGDRGSCAAPRHRPATDDPRRHGVALLVLPGLSVVEAALLAIAVAPTDAALGQTVVSDERIPSRIRQGLNVESGLNDGLCVPLLLIALGVCVG